MKKVMLGLACAAAMVVCADITSANVVGYQNMDLTALKQVMKGAMFVDVGTSTLDLQSITMDKDTPATGETMLWWWDKNTRTYTRSYWVDLYDEDGKELGKTGWGDGENWIAMGKTFKSGEGFWIQAPASAQINVSGEVVTTSPSVKSIAFDLTALKQEQVTNPFPVGAYDLQSVAMDEKTPPTGETMVWWWNKENRTYTRAYWVDLYDADGEEVGKKGWGDGENWIAIEKTFDAGEAFWAQAPATAQIVWANPFYQAE